MLVSPSPSPSSRPSSSPRPNFRSPRSLAGRLRDCSRRRDDGMTTAEYAVGTVAACGFAAILFRIVHSQAVGRLLTDVISRALHTI